MNTSPIQTHLRHVLPMVSQPSIAAALLQDPVVHHETLDLFTLNLVESSSPTFRVFEPSAWSPAAIGLRNYVSHITPSWLCAYPLSDIDDETKNKALSVSTSIMLPSNEWSLEKAIWIALTMRSEYISKGGWGPVLDVWLNDPQVQHGTILACLYGILPKPIDLFNTLLASKPSAQNIALVLHAILSNPLEPDDQLKIIQEITVENENVSSLPLSARLVILHILQTQRPQLAIRLAQQWLESHTSVNFSNNWVYQDPLTNFHELEAELYRATIHQITTLEDDPSNLCLNWKKLSIPLGFSYPSINHLTYLLQEVHTATNIDKHSAFLACQQAIQHLDEILQKIPDPLLSDARIVPILQELSEILLNLNRASYAAHLLNDARKLQPTNVTLHFLTAKALQNTNQTDEAIQLLSTALTLSLNRLDISTFLAECLESSGSWDTATSLRKALLEEASLLPQSNLTRELHALAVSAVHSKQSEIVFQTTRKLLEANPDDGEAYLYQGQSYIETGDIPEALACFTKATELNIDKPLSWIGLSDLYMITGDEEKAISVLQSAIQAVPNCVELLLKLGELYLQRNEYTQAQEILALAYNSSPNHPKVTIPYAKALIELGQIETAAQILLPSLEEFPEDLNIIFTYGKTLMALNKSEEAIPYLETVIGSPRIDQVEPSIIYAQALLNVYENNKSPRYIPSKAIQPLEKVISNDPTNLPARAIYAETLTVCKLYDQALDAFQEIFEAEIVNNPAWSIKLATGMARAAVALGKPEIAIAALQDVVNDHPNTSNPYRLLAESYLEASLFENSLLAAQSAMSFLEVDTTTTPWLVEYIKRFLNKHNTDGRKSLNNNLLDQVLRNSIETVKTIIQTQPNQIGLAISLGDLQLITGDTPSAIQSYTLIARSDQAQISDLMNAAEHLLTLDETKAGIMCLQRAVEIDTLDQGYPSTMLLTELANAYTRVGSVQMAVKYYDQAIQYTPAHLPLYVAKARILLESSQFQDASQCLEQAFSNVPPDLQSPDLHYMMAVASIAEGNYPKAMDHSRNAVEVIRTYHSEKFGMLEKDTHYYHPINYYTLAAELSRSLLHPEIGIEYLRDYASLSIHGQENQVDYIDYFCLFNELNIELEGIIAQDIEFPSPAKNTSEYPRLLALNARLSAWRGNPDQAIDFLKSAVDILTPSSIASQTNSSSVHALIYMTSDYIAVAEAAIELHEWETALNFLHKATHHTPKHPLAQLLLARFYVLQAEHQDLCTACQVIRHSPGPIALSASAIRGQHHALANLYEVLQQWQPQLDQIGLQFDDKNINRWEIRANLIFEKSDRVVDAIQQLSTYSQRHEGNALLTYTEDTSSLIAAVRRLSPGVFAPPGIDIQTAAKKTMHPVALLQLAIVAANQNPSEALEIINTALNNLKLNRSYQAALLNYYRAYLHVLQNNPHEALPNIQAALEIWTDEPRWNHLAAEINSKLGDKRAAIEYLEEAVKYEPGNANHYLALGNAYLRAIEYDLPTESSSYQKRAIQNLERATNLNPQNPETWLAMAQAYYCSGDLDQAEINVDQVLVLDPENYDALSQKAEIALKKKEPGKAHDYAKKAISLFPDRPIAHLHLARALESLNLPKEALISLEKALLDTPNPVPLLLEHASLTKQLHGPRTALEELNSLTTHYPDNVEVLEALAMAYAEDNQDEAAIQAAQKSLNLNQASLNVSKQACLSLLLGRLLRKTGQLDQAIKFLTTAIKLAPEDVEIYLELGTTYKERREYQRALLTFNQATNVAQHDPRPYYFAGLTLKDGKDYRQSELMLRRAAALAPQDVNIRRQLAAVVALNLVHNPNNLMVGLE